MWDVDQDTADRAMLGDNRFGDLSTRDKDRIATLLLEIPETDWPSVGFTEDEAAKMLKGLEEGTLDVHEIDTSTVNDKFWISVRGPLVQQAGALQALRRFMAEYPEVTVEIGTIADA